MIEQAVILAGGQGTRLKEVVKDIPKPMAMVAGKPFLAYILDHLEKYGVHHIVLSVGYKHETIRQHFGDKYGSMDLQYAVEEHPLGTGGAIKLALRYLTDDPFLLVNGDTLYAIDLHQFVDFEQKDPADITIALKLMDNPDRYGTVDTEGNRITAFREKEAGRKSGWINAGMYILKKNVFINMDETVFSFEQHVLEKGLDHLSIRGWKTDGYFIDIGIPEDYNKANEDLKTRHK